MDDLEKIRPATPTKPKVYLKRNFTNNLSYSLKTKDYLCAAITRPHL